MTYHVEFNTIYDECGKGTRQPAFMIDTATGVLHAYGDIVDVSWRLKAWKKQDPAGLVCKDIKIISFNMENLTIEEACEELNKIAGITGYAETVYKKLIEQLDEKEKTENNS